MVYVTLCYVTWSQNKKLSVRWDCFPISLGKISQTRPKHYGQIFDPRRERQFAFFFRISTFREFNMFLVVQDSTVGEVYLAKKYGENVEG